MSAEAASSEVLAMRDLSESILARSKANGQILMVYVAGSSAHHMNRADSDKDYFGIYVAPNDELFGLWPPEETYTKSGDEYDYTFHEVGKYGRLLLKGNPGIVESLFSDKAPMYETEAFVELKRLRAKFLSQSVLKHYLGYIKGQVQQYTSTKIVKRLYHALRLCGEAERIMHGEEPQVAMQGEEREALMRVRNGERDPAELLAEIDRRMDAINAAEPWDNLPKVGDEQALNSWLLDVRKGKLSLAQVPWVPPATTA